MGEDDRPVAPLVGRNDELDAAVDLVAAGGVVLTGDAGVGTTRLLHAVVAASASDHVERIRPTTGTAGLPLGSVLDRVDPAVDPSDLTGRAAHVRKLLAGPAGTRPLLVVDDAHLLDELTAGIVAQLIGSGDARLAATARRGCPWPAALGRLVATGECGVVEVRPLARDACGALVGTWLGAPLDRRSLDRLDAAAAGRPRLLEALARDGRATETSDRGWQRSGDTWRWMGVARPERLGPVVDDLLHAVGPGARELVDLLAVGGARRESVAQVLVDADALAELRAAGLVADDAEGRVTLAIGLVATVRRALQSPATLRRAQARLFEVTAATGGPVDVAERLDLAQWAVDLGREVDDGELVWASETARLAGDVASAERLVRAGLSHGAEAELVLAEILEVRHRSDEAVALLDGLAARLDGEELRARALCCEMRVWAHGCHRPDRAERAAAEAADLRDPRWRGFVDAQWATTLAMLGRLDDAGAIAGRLFRSDAPEVRLRALPAVNLVAFSAGDLLEGLGAAQEMVPVALARRADLPAGLTWVASALTLDLLALGRFAELDALLELIGADPAATQPAYWGFYQMVLARLELARGRVRTALAAAEESVDVFATTADPQGFLPVALGLLVECAAVTGHTNRVEDAVAAARRLLAVSEPRMVHLDVARSLAWGAVAAGDHRRAAAELVAAADRSAASGNRTFEAAALYDAVRLGADGTVRDRLVRVASRIDGALAAAWVAHAGALGGGPPVDLESAGDQLAEIGATLAAAEAWTAAVHAHRRAGHEAAAHRASIRARALGEGTEGAHTPGLELRAGVVSLSARERQVAELAASGRTSREIAELLGVSRRTVDNLLGRAYQKLGIAGRRDLPAVLTRPATDTPRR